MIQLLCYGIRLNKILNRKIIKQLNFVQWICKYCWYILNKTTWYLFFKKIDFTSWSEIQCSIFAFSFGCCIGAYQLYDEWRDLQ
tara:strand:+ start:778 stop:1029 length:252 start_codon:yes stop_codon:yes gene_type:complete